MFLIYVLLAILLVGPFVLMVVGYRRGRKEAFTPPSHIPNPKILVLNSTLLYAISYNIIYFVQEWFLAKGKQWIGLKSYLYHNNHNWEGSDPRDALMQGIGAAAILVIGLVLLYVYTRIRHWKSWWALFTLWLAYHGLVQSLPQFLVAPIDPGSDTGQALAYLDLPVSANLAIGFAGFLGIIWVSFVMSRFFLTLGHSARPLDHPFHRFRTIWQTVIQPALLGTVLLLPYRIPPFGRFHMTWMLLLVAIPSIFSLSWVGRTREPKGNEAWGRVLILPIILTVVILLVFQLVLRPGVVFD